MLCCKLSGEECGGNAPPTIFVKGHALYIMDAADCNRRKAKRLTRQMLKDIDNDRIYIDTRGMSRVEIASIVSAFRERDHNTYQ